MRQIYCDHAATTSVKKEVLEEMIPYFSEKYGNPSSIYEIGKVNKEAIEIARKRVAKAINANDDEIYFTSCGTESDNLALKGFAFANRYKGNHIITSKIEHPAILNTCKKLEQFGFRVTYLDVDKDGFISLEQLKRSINYRTILISIMFANNEIGTIQNIKEIVKIAHKYGIVFHTDAVQAVGNVKIDVKNMNIDMLSMSGHKFYGPKGVGALYVKKGIKFDRMQDGGHQEKDKRSGTENVAGIVGIGKAIEIASHSLENHTKQLIEIREYFLKQLEEKIGKENFKLNGDRQNRLPGNLSISFKDFDNTLMLLKLNEVGIYASGGSACSSSEKNPSHVLKAINLSDEWIDGTIRFTFGEENTKEDVDYIVQNIKNIYQNYQ